MLKKIKSSLLSHEIASHSYSHIIFGNAVRDVAQREFTEGMNILRRHGEQPISFVFPRNSINYLDLLQNVGFRAYRGLEPSWYANIPGKLKKVCHILDQTLAITPPVITPIRINGLINIPASMLYLPMNGFRRHIPLSSRVKKAHKGIRKAIAKKQIFHLWFHPFNIATDQDKLLKGLEVIFAKVKEEKAKGNMEVMTMADIVSIDIPNK